MKILEISKLNLFLFTKLPGISYIEYFSNFPNFPKFLELSKLENSEISRFFFNFKSQSFAPKIGNIGNVRPFDIPHFSQFCQISYFPFDINQLQRFNVSTLISYSSKNFLDWQIHTIIKFLKLFNFEN